MGWNIIELDRTAPTSLEDLLSAAVASHHTCCDVLACEIVHCVAYFAIQFPDGTIAATVAFLSHPQYTQLAYAAFDEDGQPAAYECPQSILDLLTPPRTDGARRWRARRLLRQRAKLGLVFPST